METASGDNVFIIGVPFGKIGITLREGAVCRVGFLPAEAPLSPLSCVLTRQVAAQLACYFDDPAFHFDLPLHLAGTPFQQRVWATLRAIPSGSTRSYGELARELSSGPRAVGGACHANPMPILIPCHRVVTMTGLGGYTGSAPGGGLAIKRWLLAHERGI